MLVYLVEDDSDIARLVQHHLQMSGYQAHMFVSGTSVLQEAIKELPRLFILDIMWPGGDGLELCHQIRQHTQLAKTPIIFMTAKVAESDRVRGLDLGADDYITKPFSPRELIARVRAVLRRTRTSPSKPVLKFDDVEINSRSITLRVHNEEVPVTTREFRLLEFLARNAGHVFSRDQRLNAVWGVRSFVTRVLLMFTSGVSAKKSSQNRTIPATSERSTVRATGLKLSKEWWMISNCKVIFEIELCGAMLTCFE